MPDGGSCFSGASLDQTAHYLQAGERMPGCVSGINRSSDFAAGCLCSLNLNLNKSVVWQTARFKASTTQHGLQLEKIREFKSTGCGGLTSLSPRPNIDIFPFVGDAFSFLLEPLNVL